MTTQPAGCNTGPIIRRTTSDVTFSDQLASDQVIPTGSQMLVWEVDLAFSTAAAGGFNMLIPKDIDPEGLYRVLLDSRASLPPLVATVAPQAPLADSDAPEPVSLTIAQGDQKFHHQRSPDDAPTPFHEGEYDDESDEVELLDAASPSGPPGKVTAGNVATLGVVDKGAGVELKFGSVLDAHVPAADLAK